MTLKIGTIGCSRAAQKYFFPYINSSEYADIKFVGSRSTKKAEEWAKKYQCNKFGNYADVINSDVDVVYISLPIAMHEEWSIKAANAGKHVLWKKELGGGVLNDVTCYPICASRIIFQSEPVSVLAHLEFDKKFHVDKSADVFLKYKDEKTAFVSSGFNNYYQSKYDVWGSNAKISTKRTYAVPRNYKTSIYFHKDDKIFETVIPPADQFGLMFDIFCSVITNKIENPYDFEKDLLNQAKLMESIRISSKDKKLVFLSDLKD